MNILCPICNEGNLQKRQQQRKVNYKTHSGHVDFYYSECDECGAEVAQGKDASLNKRAMIAFQRETEGLISAQEVKDLRTQYGITQSEAGMIFGGGEKAFAKYEANEVIPSLAMSTLLKVCSKDRNFFKAVLDVRQSEAKANIAKIEMEINKTKGTLASTYRVIQEKYEYLRSHFNGWEKLAHPLQKATSDKFFLDSSTISIRIGGVGQTTSQDLELN